MRTLILPLVDTVEGNADMSRATFFIQSCPTCGRRLQVRVECLGKSVGCPHCGGKFNAADPANRILPPVSGTSILDRAEELLDSTNVRKAHPH